LTLFPAAIVSVMASVPVHAEPAMLDIAKYRETFSNEFRGNPEVSAHGPSTRWIAHSPWNGDFGNAHFADPEPGFPSPPGRTGYVSRLAWKPMENGDLACCRKETDKDTDSSSNAATLKLSRSFHPDQVNGLPSG
jgi:hypothetical protein